MASSEGLLRAMKEMKNGSKAGFSTFYRATLQYVYKSSFALWRNNEDACLFMADFYPYMYMRITSFKDSEDITQWLSDMLLSKFTLMTGKRDINIDPGSIGKNILMSKDDADRVWHLLEARIHFPKEDKKAWKKGLEVPIRILIFVGIVSAIALVLLWRFGPQLSGASESETDKKIEAVPEPTKEDTLQEIQDLQDQLDSKSGFDPDATEEDLLERLGQDLSIKTEEKDITEKYGNTVPSMDQSIKTSQTTLEQKPYETKTQSNMGNHADSKLDTTVSKHETVTTDEVPTITSDDIKLKYGNGLYFTGR